MERVSNKTTQPIERPQSDPRIDSPQIKVIYPTETPMNPVRESTSVKPLEVDPNEVQLIETKPHIEHVCTLSLQDALKQHLIPLILGGLIMLIVGYLIGKK